MERERLREQVRAAVMERLGPGVGHAPLAASRAPAADLVTWRRFDDPWPPAARQLVTEADVMRARGGTRILPVAGDAIVTPLARETAGRVGVAFEGGAAPGPAARPDGGGPRPSALRTVVMAADHGGFALKESLKPFVADLGFAVLDLGTSDAQPVDYPDFAHRAAAAVASGRAEFGIVVDAVGIASAMCANRHRGIRAAPCSTAEQAQSAREHNDANVLTLGGRHLGDPAARALAKVFLETPFAGGRHLPRVRKIDPPGGG
jgi:ribose 5-phosphate isomerase B